MVYKESNISFILTLEKSPQAKKTVNSNQQIESHKFKLLIKIWPDHCQ